MSDLPAEGQNIIWRFKGEKGWSSWRHPWRVHKVVASGSVVVLISGFAEKAVSLADIEWHQKHGD